MPPKKKARAPGAPGRVEAIGQGRTEDGKFQKKLPAPVQEEAIAALVEKREATLAAGKSFRPTAEEWQAIVTEARHLSTRGHSVAAIAEGLSLPESVIRRALARGEELAERGADPLLSRHWIAVLLMHAAEEALLGGEYDEARKAAMDLARLEGIVTGSPNQQVNVLVKSEEEVSVDIREWIEADANRED